MAAGRVRRIRPLAPKATILEMQEVLRKPKLAKLISPSIMDEFLASYRKSLQLIQAKSSIMVCRDPRDDNFLQLAEDCPPRGVLATTDLRCSIPIFSSAYPLDAAGVTCPNRASLYGPLESD